MRKKIMAAAAAACVISALLAVRVYILQNDETIIKASSGRGQYRVSEVRGYAAVYDCKGRKLNSTAEEYRAVVNPNSAKTANILPYLSDIETFHNGMQGNLPFLCGVTAESIDGVTVFRRYVRTAENQPAEHIVGYTSCGEGVCGIEYAFNDFLRENYTVNEAVFSVNAVGGVLDGLYSDVSPAEDIKAGVRLTLDGDIERICEEAMENHGVRMGAAVVMDVKTGDIKACVSFPRFNAACPAESLDDPDAPFVNRAFSAYSVGSIFKLVTSAAALESGISPEFTCSCKGSADVGGQVFNCHKWGGHGEADMRQALTGSCNPYFITLGGYINREKFLETAESLGFGKENVFADGLVSQAGYLPTKRELAVPAEKANFSFGQGKLTATPVQICAMTAAIANNGIYSKPRLVLGLTDSEGEYTPLSQPERERAVSYRTAKLLRSFMEDVVNADNSMSKSYRVESAGKTSTAQTGRFDDDGSEQFNCWFTGYFPADKPCYAVTVMIENGVSGNVTCGPVYREIAEKISAGQGKNLPDS